MLGYDYFVLLLVQVFINLLSNSDFIHFFSHSQSAIWTTCVIKAEVFIKQYRKYL